MLGRDRVGEGHPRRRIRNGDERQGERRPRSRAPPRPGGRASSIASRITVSTAAATSRPSGPCSAWAHRSRPIHSGVRRVARDHHQLGGTGDAVDPHLARELALRLLYVAVARARDHVDRRDPLGADRQRRDRLGAADGEDLVRAADRGRREDDVGDLLVLAGRRRGEQPRARPRPPSPGCSPSAPSRDRRRPRPARRSRRLPPAPREGRRSVPAPAPPAVDLQAVPRPPRGCWRRRSRGRRAARARAAMERRSPPLRTGGRRPDRCGRRRSETRSRPAPSRRRSGPRR